MWRDWDEGDRKYYPEGAWDSWTGTLPGFCDDAWWDLPDARQAGMGMLQVDEIEAFVSVYVTTPSLQTFKLYFDGTHEGSDDECDMPVESYTTQPLPYAYDQPSSGSFDEVFSLYVKSHLGDVQLKFAFDEQLDDEDVLTSAGSPGRTAPKERALAIDSLQQRPNLPSRATFTNGTR